MTRKIINVCVVFALMLGCWGGVLAAVVCSHIGCETTAPAAGKASTTHDDHGMACGKMIKPEDHSGHVSAHGGHGGEPTSGAQEQSSPVVLHTIVPAQHDQFCSHCMSRQETPPSPLSEWQCNSAGRGGSFAAPIATVQIESTAPVYLRKITPAQHAPPGTSARHLLLNVFRI